MDAKQAEANQAPPSYSQASGNPTAPPAGSLSYPPPQGGAYPPQQGGAYPPPQGGAYPPPQTGAYPPQQAGAYPPPQGGAYPPPQGGAYPPQQPGAVYPPQTYQPQPAAAPGVVTVVSQPVTVVSQPRTTYGEHPIQQQCMYCQQQIVTATEQKLGMMNWVGFAGVCAAGLVCPIVWLGCQFIPLCVTGMKDVEHQCPSCHRVVGTYNRMG